MKQSIFNYMCATLLLVLAVCVTTASQAADQDSTKLAKVYINPGHGSWGTSSYSSDQWTNTINHQSHYLDDDNSVVDTLGFTETRTNLWKAAELRDRLVNTYGFNKDSVFMSRTQNGVQEDNGSQLVNPVTIKAAIKSCAPDYLILVHSNSIALNSTTNYFLTLYDGCGNYTHLSKEWKTTNPVRVKTLPSADMGIAAKEYVYDDTVAVRITQSPHAYCGGDTTYHSYYNSDSTLVVMSSALSHILKEHGRPGYQAEASAYSYEPEAHRLLSQDYCRQEGWRWASAINGWFGGEKYSKGAILGTVKDGTTSLDHDCYTYASDNDTRISYDKYYPLNKVTVYLYKVTNAPESNDAETVAALVKSEGTYVASYTTDNEYNGIYYFDDLEPGTYIVDYSKISGYKASYYVATVTADATTYHNELKFPEVIEAADEYTFEQVGRTYRYQNNGYKIRRALYRDNVFYILSHDLSTGRPYTPLLRVIDPDNCRLMKTMDTTTNINTKNTSNSYTSKTMLWSLSDIAFTDDGVLIGTNSNSLGYSSSSSSNITGDFFMYAWGTDGVDTTSLWKSAPTNVYTLTAKGASSSAVVGGNSSNLMSNSFDIVGDYSSFSYYFDSHAGNDWSSGYPIRYLRWKMTGSGSTVTFSSQNVAGNDNLDFETPKSGGSGTVDEYTMMIHNPLSDTSSSDTLVVDGKLMDLTAIRSTFSSTTVDENSTTYTTSTPFTGTSSLNIGTSGGHFFSYGESTLFVTPVYTPADSNGDDKCHFGLRLYDVTGGLGAAKQIGSYKDDGESEYLICSDTLGFMAAFGKYSECGDIDLYLIVDDSIAKVSSRKGFYICGPSVQTEYCEMNNWSERGDTVNAVPLTKHSDGYYYYDEDGYGHEGKLSMEAQKEFLFSQVLDLTRDSTFSENSIVPVDMHVAYSSGVTSSTSAYEENDYALTSGDTYGETQYVNFLTKGGSSSTGSTYLEQSGLTAPTFNLPSGEYTIRLYIDKDVTVNGSSQKLSYYLIKDRSYRFYDPVADNDLKETDADESYATYKSFYDCHAVLIPSDVDILYVTGTDASAGAVYMSKVDKTDTAKDYIVNDTNFILPAYTPVVLASKTTSGAYAQWRTMEYYSDDVNFARDTFLTANVLKGQLSATDLSGKASTGETVYIFGYQTVRDTVNTTTKDSDGNETTEQTINATTSVGFYKPYTNQTGAVNTVYLLVSDSDAQSTAKFLYISFDAPSTDDDDSDDATTAIEDVSEETTVTVSGGGDDYYTLQGVRLGSERPAVRGVYIRNGKKVIID